MKKRLGILSIGALIAFVAVFSLNSNGASAHSARTASVQDGGSDSDSNDCASDDDSNNASLNASNAALSDANSDEADDDSGCNTDQSPHKVTICHATSSETNPWVRIVVDEHATNGHFDNNGTPLAGHEGDVLLQGDVPCPAPPSPASTASATFDMQCNTLLAGPLMTAQVTVVGPDPQPSQFLSFVITSGSLLNNVQDLSWVSRSYSVLEPYAFGVPAGASLTANLVLGTTTVSSQTFTVPDCSPVVTTTTAPAPTTTQPAPTTTAPAPTTTVAPTTTQPAPTTVATTQPPVPPTGKLPKTGSSSGILVAIAALLLLVGGSLLAVRRRPATS